MGTLGFTFNPSALSTGEYLSLLSVLLLCVVLYMTYKIIWHPDFGLPVRRRLMCRRLQVERNQVAFVPFWWSNVQVQRAIGKHWKETMRQSLPASHNTK